MYKIISALSLVVLLVGCAGVEKPVANVGCGGQSWKELGMSAAKSFKPVRTFDTYIESCGSSLDPNAKAAFVDGYARALVDICNFKTGFEIGAANNEFPDVCPFEVRADFQNGFAQGKREYDTKMRELKRTADALEERAKKRSPFQNGSSLGDSGWSTGVNE